MSLFSYPDVNKGKAGKVESSKEGKEWRVQNCHHCVTAGEGALERIWVVSDFYLVLSVILIAYMQAGHQLVAADKRVLVVFEKVKI